MLVYPVRMKIDVGHCLDDCEKAVAGVEPLDLICEFETIEDAPRVRGKVIDVRHEVRRDVLGIAEQPDKGEGARVIEWILPLWVGGLA